MRLKLDENLGRAATGTLRDAGHDVATVVGQSMSGATDEVLFETCRREGRALVTLDLDFADPRRFDPSSTAGVAVLRVPNRPGREQIDATVAQLIAALAHADVTGQLWVVEVARVRRYEPPTD